MQDAGDSRGVFLSSQGALACRVVQVEKTDRLYRNFRDCVTLEDLDVEIHLPKEGQIISKDSKSQAKLVHGIQLVIARNYIENLRDEVRKGMREKAAQGTYYRCTGYRGKCDLQYFREEVMAERLGQVLQAIHVPDGILAQLEESLLSDKTHEESLKKRQAERIEQRLTPTPQAVGAGLR